MVAPGHLLAIGPRARWDAREYWNLLASARTEAASVSDPVEARARVGELLAESTILHLVSDVPVGIFLSGGIDSSALVALVSDTGATPRTFTVTCPGTTFDEACHARSVAKAFAADHTEIALSELDLLSQLPEAMAGVDHPSGDGINTFVVSRAVRGAGIKVALSGLGGDEFFGGYPSFQRTQRLASFGPLLWRSPIGARRAAATAVRAFGRESVASNKAAALLETDGSVANTFPLFRQMFSAEQRRQLLTTTGDSYTRNNDPYVSLLQSASGRQGPVTGTMQLVSYAEARTYMHDVLLRDTDQMAMRHGLEVRVPFLDHALVEYLMGLPDALKQSNGQPKQLLVNSLKNPLPAAAAARRKQGFELPFDPWMRSSLQDFCAHHLEELAKTEVFRSAAVRAIWRSFLERDGRVTWSRPWTLVALNAWMAQNRISV
jgi:asparagine synthase (glutamine-hydrolysing)